MQALIAPEHFRRKLDIGAVLPECAAMRTSKPENEALTVCRAIFELAEADVRPTADLLGRLLGLDQSRVATLIARLRKMRLLTVAEDGRLNLTMPGLVIATTAPEVRFADPPPLRARHQAA